jgi:hypothetical protein
MYDLPPNAEKALVQYTCVYCVSESTMYACDPQDHYRYHSLVNFYRAPRSNFRARVDLASNFYFSPGGARPNIAHPRDSSDEMGLEVQG